MEDGTSHDRQVDFVGRDNCFSGDDKQLDLSFSLARQCLFNALYLLECSESKSLNSALQHSSSAEENESREPASYKNGNYKIISGGDSKSSNLIVGLGNINANGDAKELKGGNGPNATLHSSLLDYEDFCRSEKRMLKEALLADLAYVELELGNPLKALTMARCLLALSECSKIYIFLGNVYAAVSLCLLNQPNEAAKHLSTYLSGGSNVELPYSQEDCEQLRATKNVDCEESNGGSLTAKNSSLDESQGIAFLKPEEARGTLYANLAALSAMQGDLEQAHRLATQALSAIPDSQEAVLTAIYVDLVSGKKQEALAKLKQCSRVRFLTGRQR